MPSGSEPGSRLSNQNRKVHKARADKKAWDIMINRRRGTVIAGALIGLYAMAGTATAGEFKREGWTVPDPSTARFLKQRVLDAVEDIPGAETVHRSYRTSEGTYFATLDHQNRRYGYYVDTNGKPPMEFLILDYQGDGVFEYRVDIQAEGAVAPTPCFILRGRDSE